MTIKTSLASIARARATLGRPIKEVSDELLASAKGKVQELPNETRADLDGDGSVDLYVDGGRQNPTTLDVVDERRDDSTLITSAENGTVDAVSASTITRWGDFKGHVTTTTGLNSRGRARDSAVLYATAGQHGVSVSLDGGIDTHDAFVDKVDRHGELLEDLAGNSVYAQKHLERVTSDPAYLGWESAIPHARHVKQTTATAFAMFLNHLKE